MKIALLAPVALPVPPVGYGGTELVIAMLAEGLVQRGHAVTLFASGDSRAPGELASVYPRALEALGVSDKACYMPYELAHVAQAFARAGEFDVVHDHTKISGTLFSRFSPTPCVTTVHNDFTAERRLVYGAFPDHAYVSISRAHAARMPELGFVGTVYNGIDLAPVRYSAAKDDYLLFLGRLDADKGAHTAARLAAELDLPLVMAGRLSDKDVPFFEAEVAPYLDGRRRRYIGEVTGEPKWALYAGARALLFPIQWEEPFGLVMIEAMAAGTPVMATNWGSVPEVVEDGVSGAIAPRGATLAELAEATHRALACNPSDCRERVEANFSQDRMVESYLDVYEQVIASWPAHQPAGVDAGLRAV